MRLEFLEEIYTIAKTEEKTILLVRHAINHQFYIEKILHTAVDRTVYKQLMQHPHPNIPLLYDVIPKENGCILIEEFINGKTLEYVLSERQLSDEEIRDIMKQLLSAVSHLHHLRPPLIHRDIKPGNIMVMDQGQVYVIDFEIARVFKQDKSKDTQVLGSVGYASPEQFGFQQSDHRSDIYALGAVLKTMVQKDVQKQTLPGPFQAVIDTCLQLDPDKRYQSAEAMAQALQLSPSEEIKRFSCLAILKRIPGIRTDTLVVRLLFLAYYGLCFFIGSCLEVKPQPSLPTLYMERFTMGLCLAIIPSVMSDAGMLFPRIPPHQNHKAVKFIKGVLLWILISLCIVFLAAIVALLLESLL